MNCPSVAGKQLLGTQPLFAQNQNFRFAAALLPGKPSTSRPHSSAAPAQGCRSGWFAICTTLRTPRTARFAWRTTHHAALPGKRKVDVGSHEWIGSEQGFSAHIRGRDQRFRASNPGPW